MSHVVEVQEIDDLMGLSETQAALGIAMRVVPYSTLRQIPVHRAC